MCAGWDVTGGATESWGRGRQGCAACVGSGVIATRYLLTSVFLGISAANSFEVMSKPGIENGCMRGTLGLLACGFSGASFITQPLESFVWGYRKLFVGAIRNVGLYEVRVRGR